MHKNPIWNCEIICEITNKIAYDLEVKVGVIHNPCSKCGDIKTCVTLACDVKVIGCKLREPGEEVFQSFVVVKCYLRHMIVYIDWLYTRETCRCNSQWHRTVVVVKDHLEQINKELMVRHHLKQINGGWSLEGHLKQINEEHCGLRPPEEHGD